MSITEHPDEEVIRAYFTVLSILARADKLLRVGRVPPDIAAKCIPLLAPIEGEYARRGFRTMMPACGGLIPYKPSSVEQVTHLVLRRLPDEPAVYYADRLRKRLERMMVELPESAGPAPAFKN